jgi:hypothetical protein
MPVFRYLPENGERLAEIEKQLKKLDGEMSSPNVKQIKYEELFALQHKLNVERDSMRIQG